MFICVGLGLGSDSAAQLKYLKHEPDLNPQMRNTSCFSPVQVIIVSSFPAGMVARDQQAVNQIRQTNHIHLPPQFINIFQLKLIS